MSGSLTKQYTFTPVQLTHSEPIGEHTVYGCGCNYLKSAKGESYWSRCEEHKKVRHE